MNRRIATTVALVAMASATVAACGATVKGTAQPADSEDRKAAMTSIRADAPPTTRALAPPKWIDASKLTGVAMLPRDSVDHAQFGGVPAPGVKILRPINASGDMKMCTLGPAISAGARQGFLTAGHCAGPFSPDQYLQTATSGETTLLASAASAVDDHAAVDSAAIWTSAAADPRAAMIAGIPVAGVMSEADARAALPIDTPICLDGAITGISCGALLSAESTIRYAIPAQDGDSGGPVFVVGQDRRAMLVGIHKGIDTNGVATYIAPALARLGAVAITG